MQLTAGRGLLSGSPAHSTPPVRENLGTGLLVVAQRRFRFNMDDGVGPRKAVIDLLFEMITEIVRRLQIHIPGQDKVQVDVPFRARLSGP